MADLDSPAAFIERVIRDFIAGPENSLTDSGGEPAWEEFLLGFCRGDDPIWDGYKTKHIGPFHWTPVEAFNMIFPESPAQASELTVAAWILPHRETTKADNRKEKTYPAERWARARIFGERANAKLRQRVVDALAGAETDATAPQLSPHWARHTSKRFGFASTWSERHAAHACGLGTFGLCDGLITTKGKAHRVGSIIGRFDLEPVPRPYSDHRAYCLFFTTGRCLECVDRCPVGALSRSGHDKVKCLAHVRPGTKEYIKTNYGFDGYGCGLCQTGVPCESKIPTVDDLLDQ